MLQSNLQNELANVIISERVRRAARDRRGKRR